MRPAAYAQPLLRISMGLVFLYFGVQQLIDPSYWIGFVPTWMLSFGASASTLVMINAIVELTLGSLLLVGLYTAPVSLILSVHLLVIALSIGFNPLGVRDLGLAIATFVVFLNGADSYCLDVRFSR